jgi:ATP-binding cassette, subfamily B, bacterial
MALNMVRRTRIPLLVETTNALDLIVEGAVKRALDEDRGGGTTVLVVHRLAIVVKADAIALAHKGKSVQISTDVELTETRGEFVDRYSEPIDEAQVTT